MQSTVFSYQMPILFFRFHGDRAGFKPQEQINAACQDGERQEYQLPAKFRSRIEENQVDQLSQDHHAGKNKQRSA